MFLLGTATTVGTIDVGAWGAAPDVMGLEVTNTVIWLGEMLEEAGSCMTECTLVTGLGLGLGFRAETAAGTAALVLEPGVTMEAGPL